MGNRIVRIWLVNRHNWDEFPLPDNLVEARAQIDRWLGEIPPEHYKTAKIEISGDYGSAEVECAVYYDRPETSEERRAREQEERQRAAFDADVKQRQELAQLDFLKRKYEA